MTPASSRPRVLDRIAAGRLLPVLRSTDAAATLALARRLVDAGVVLLEVTTTVPTWEAIVGTLRAEYPHVCVGAGTVTDADQARAAVAAGAAFCVSPWLTPLVRATLEQNGVPLIEGGLTPSEVLPAARHGMAKLFPAHVGGVEYLRSLLAVAPDARIVPTGGIPLAEARRWLDAGAVAVGVGGDLARADDLRAQIAQVLG
jgi:2-dehydro-3-deoxyphosphogluconate aldolase/(4S)-4-hydroxy-2-oxoglutarate aldolase